MLIVNTKNLKKNLFGESTKKVLIEVFETSCVSFLCLVVVFIFMFL